MMLKQSLGWGRRMVLVASCGMAATLPGVETIPVPIMDGPAGVQVLFMGTDLIMLKDRDFHRVNRISDNAYILEIKGRTVQVPLSSRSVRLKVEPALKLSSVSVQVEALSSKRAYTPANNPYRKRQAALGAAGGAAAAADLAMDNVVAHASSMQSMTISRENPDVVSSVGQEMASREHALAATIAQENIAGNESARLADELAEERFDAMEVDFELSSATPLEDPSVVVVMRYRHPGAPRGTERDMVHAQSLKGLDRTPKKISIRQGGFPPGFTLEEVQVHIYDGGREVASNVAPKRVALARDDAFQYIVMEHVSANRGATVSASPALGSLSAERRAQIPGDALQRTYHVKVDKEGRPQGAYMDAACKVRVEPGVVADALNEILFKPALEKGRPVEGVATVRLADLPR